MGKLTVLFYACFDLMAHRTPKRIYSNRALESWFEKLACGWERFFSPEILEMARELYKRDEVHTLELTEQGAGVYARHEAAECYAMVDWPKDGAFQVRSSTDRETYAHALAAAGLYEIEELVSEEVSALPSDEAPQRKPSAKKARQAPSANPPALARRLRLKFEPSPAGLVMDVFWEGSGKFVSALSPLKAKEEVSAHEREKIIRLASLARKSGFGLDAAKGRYRTEGYDRVPEFILHELDNWRKYFAVDECAEFAFLARGVRDVQVAGKASVKDADHLKLDWTLSMGRERLNLTEGKKLLRQPDAPVYLKGRGLVRLPSERAQWLLDWKDVLKNPLSGILPNYMLFSLFGQPSLKLNIAAGLLQWRERLSATEGDETPLPDFLRPYQRQGVRWMHHLLSDGCHALLADEMGLGKTVQILSLLHAYPVADLPTLIVCPASVVPVWRSEIERFFPQTSVEVLKSGHDFVKTPGPRLWLSSYTQLRRHKSLLDKAQFGYIILDEAQFIKNPEAKVTQACQCLKGKHRVALTGTPLENRYLDVWTLFRFLMPGLLGLRRHFEATLDMHATEALADRIRTQIAPFVLRRTKQDVATELPPKVEVDLMCPMTDVQREEYERLTKEGLQSLGSNINEAVRQRSMGFLTLLTRLRQVSCDPNLLPWANTALEHSGKLNALSEKLSEILASGHKVVIFSQFVTLLNRVRQLLATRFPQTPVYELTGQTIDRAVPVNAFQKLDGPGCILVSLRAGGTGITLHAADYVFLLDPWWNPAVEDQAVDRVHRIGQDRTVFVYRMIAAGGIEERIQQLKAAKRSQFDRVVGKLIDVSDFGNYFRTLSDLIELIPSATEVASDQAAIEEVSASSDII